MIRQPNASQAAHRVRVAPRSAGSADAASALRIGLHRRIRHVLVVEDEPDISALLIHVFDSEGYDVVTARDAFTAINLVRLHRPDVITLDLGLPDMDGRELLHLLKADESTRTIPVIIVSASCSLLCSDDYGLAAAVLPKPFDLGELLRLTRVALAGAA